MKVLIFGSGFAGEGHTDAFCHAGVEVECMSRFNLDRNIPFGWSHRKEDGAVRLNNNYTHALHEC